MCLADLGENLAWWCGVYILGNGIIWPRKLLHEVSLSECSTAEAAQRSYEVHSQEEKWNLEYETQDTRRWQVNSDSDRRLHTRNNKKKSQVVLFFFLNIMGGGRGNGSTINCEEKNKILVKHFGMLTDYEANSLKSVARQLSELIAHELKINYYKIDFCTFYIHIISLNI